MAVVLMQKGEQDVSEEKKKGPGGRPTKYRQSIARAICIRLMLGESLNVICRRAGYPSKTSVFTWLTKYPEFLDQYQRAREIQQEHHLDEMLEIADDGSNDWMEKFNREGESIGWQLNGEHVQRSKLRVDTRKWIMERMASKRFGQKQAIDHTSSDKSMTPTRIEIVAPSPKT